MDSRSSVLGGGAEQFDGHGDPLVVVGLARIQS
jgi:hypothetical protein